MITNEQRAHDLSVAYHSSLFERMQLNIEPSDSEFLAMTESYINFYNKILQKLDEKFPQK